MNSFNNKFFQVRIIVPHVILFNLLISIAQAQVTLDGSFGANGSLAGPNYAITDDLGKQVGSNLFHSFGQFNVNTGESATFSGPASVSNILSRVTGGTVSNIDGLLRSTIPAANLYLLNPAGVIFGPNASLDVQGSFHASTADYLRLADDVRFNAQPSPGDALLTTASPVAFGFLGAVQAADIAVEGSFLQVPDGKTLSVIGGDVEITDGTLYAPGGQVNIASVASGGEVVPNAPGTPPGMEMMSFTDQGNITISQSTNPRPEIGGQQIGNVDVSGDGGGTLVIRGGQLTIDDGFIFANTLGNVNGASTAIDIDVTGTVAGNGTILTAEANGAGNTGDIRFNADRLEITGDSDFRNVTRGSANGSDINVTASELFMSGTALLQTISDGGGDVGSIHINVNNLIMTDFARVFAVNNSDGTGGTIEVTATESINMMSGEITGINLAIEAFTFDVGKGGDIFITTPTLNIDRGGSIYAYTTHDGDAGNLVIDVDQMTLTRSAQVGSVSVGGLTSTEGDAAVGIGKGGQVTITATGTVTISDQEIRNGFDFHSGILTISYADGDVGNLNLTAAKLVIANEGLIEGSTKNSGQAGNINITVNELVLDHGLITAGTEGAGDAGNIAITAGRITINGGGTIPVSVVSKGISGSILTSTNDSGQGGNISMSATDIQLTDGATISSVSTGTGDAGDITINAANIFQSTNSSVTSQATQADGGDIVLNAVERVHLIDSQITTSVESGQGNGGNITIDPVFVILDNSEIIADAFGGAGGNIRIVADNFFASPDSIVRASSQLGISGSVIVDSPDTNISGGLLTLPAGFFDASANLSERCGARTGPHQSSFTHVGRIGLPFEPDNYLPAFAMDAQWQSASRPPQSSAQAASLGDEGIGEPSYGPIAGNEQAAVLALLGLPCDE